jgi:hypothetical protein
VHWENQAHGAYRKVQVPDGLDVEDSDMRGEPATEAAEIVLPAEVPLTAAEDVEDINMGSDSIVAEKKPEATISGMDLGCEDDELILGRSKSELVELASIQVARCFRANGVEISDQEIKQVAAMQVELAAVDVAEIFYRSALQKRHRSLG